jgi:hypothetical protein
MYCLTGKQVRRVCATRSPRRYGDLAGARVEHREVAEAGVRDCGLRAKSLSHRIANTARVSNMRAG